MLIHRPRLLLDSIESSCYNVSCPTLISFYCYIVMVFFFFFFFFWFFVFLFVCLFVCFCFCFVLFFFCLLVFKRFNGRVMGSLLAHVCPCLKKNVIVRSKIVFFV